MCTTRAQSIQQHVLYPLLEYWLLLTRTTSISRILISVIQKPNS